MATTEELTALRLAVEGLTEQLRESKLDRAALHASVRVRSRIIVGLLAIVIAGGLGIGLVARQAHDASDRANSAAHGQYTNCINANSARDDNRDLWNSVLGTLTPLTVTPQGKAFVANLHADVDKLTAHRPCHAA